MSFIVADECTLPTVERPLRLAEFAIRAAVTDVVDARRDSVTNCTCDDCPIPFLTIGTADGDHDGASA
jgi:hypothetical protein